MAIGACGASSAAAWLIITNVEVAKILRIDPTPETVNAESTPAA
jgi:hypothetical protein